MRDTNTYSIRDLENLTGIRAHTIRMWEQRYELVTPKRTDTNIRYYDSEDLKYMLNVALLNSNGVRISKIAKMSQDEVYVKVRETLSRTFDYQSQISALTAATIDINEEQFERIMSTSILQFGFEKTMLNIVYPFLSRIGMLWTTNAINPAQEHFITGLIRQKIIVAIDGQYRDKSTGTGKKYILFLPSGELHEISLLFSYYLLKVRGNQVIYLGQNLPLKDLQEVYTTHKPATLVTIITSSPSASVVEEYLFEIGERFPTADVLVSGFQVMGQDYKTSKNVQILQKPQDLIRYSEDKAAE